MTGAHLTINARNEDDVETDLIMQKLSSVGSAYSFKEPRMNQEGCRINEPAKLNETKPMTISIKRKSWTSWDELF